MTTPPPRWAVPGEVRYREEIPSLLKKFDMMVEVGTFHGDHLKLLMERYKPVRALGVDHRPFCCAKTCENVDSVRHAQMFAKSDEVAQYIAANSLDYVYIDGDHRYKSVMRDIVVWWPKVRPGGILAGHDFSGCMGHMVPIRDVQRAVRSTLHRWGVMVFDVPPDDRTPCNLDRFKDGRFNVTHMGSFYCIKQ